MLTADQSLIQNFQVNPAKEVASNPTLDRRFASGVFCLKLRGKVGDDQSISLRSVRETLAQHDFRHLHIQITSSGGIAHEAFSIYDHLRALPVPVSTEAISECLSAGMIILMAGDLRIASGEVELLNHPASVDRSVLPESVTASSLRAQASNLAELDERIARLFAVRTGFDAQWFRTESETEECLSLADAIQTGLLHEFGGLPQRIRPSWPNAVKMLPAGVYLPQYLRSQNYLNACKCVASLYGDVAP